VANEGGGERRSLSRRDLLRAGVVAGGTAFWVAPVVRTVVARAAEGSVGCDLYDCGNFAPPVCGTPSVGPTCYSFRDVTGACVCVQPDGGVPDCSACAASSQPYCIPTRNCTFAYVCAVPCGSVGGD